MKDQTIAALEKENRHLRDLLKPFDFQLSNPLVDQQCLCDRLELSHVEAVSEFLHRHIQPALLSDHSADAAKMVAPQEAEPVAWGESYNGGMFFNTVSLTKTRHHTFPLYAQPAPASAVPVEGDAYYYAVRLASSMWEQHYPEAKDWSPLDTTMGVLTQIDNMVTGLCRAQPAPQEAEPVAWQGPGEAPHSYSPDLTAGGDDCRVCGHTWAAHLTPVPATAVPVEGATHRADGPFGDLMQTTLELPVDTEGRQALLQKIAALRAQSAPAPAVPVEGLRDALIRCREIAMQSEAAPLSMCEIIKRVDMALGDETPLPEWMRAQPAPQVKALAEAAIRDCAAGAPISAANLARDILSALSGEAQR